VGEPPPEARHLVVTLRRRNSIAKRLPSKDCLDKLAPHPASRCACHVSAYRRTTFHSEAGTLRSGFPPPLGFLKKRFSPFGGGGPKGVKLRKNLRKKPPCDRVLFPPRVMEPRGRMFSRLNLLYVRPPICKNYRCACSLRSVRIEYPSRPHCCFVD